MMMKYSLSLLILTTFIACDKGHNYASKKTFVVTDKMKEEIFQKELNANRIETCEVEEKKLSFFRRAKKSILGLFTKKDESFDITYPQVLTDRVLRELKEYIIEKQKFAPEEFWIAIGKETETYINNYLIEEFVGLTDEQYIELRDLVAFSFLFYFQEAEKKSGYEIHLDKEDLPLSKIRIAYESEAKFEERVKLSICEQEKLLEIAFLEDEAFLKPSDVTARVICEKDNNMMRIDVVKDTKVTLSMADSKASKQLTLNMGDFVVNSTNQKATLKHSQDGNEIELEVKVKRKGDQKFISNKVFSLNAHLGDGTDFSMKKLKCKSVKPLRLE